jgi:hypothetical protein
MSDLLAATLSCLYVNGPTLPLSDHTKASFLAQISRDFNSLPFEVVDAGDVDPEFSDPWAMQLHIANTGILPVYSGHPPAYWTRLENWMLRAVHDACHIDTLADFSFRGELIAYSYQASRMNDPIHRSILFSEVILQAAYTVTNGRFPQEQRLVNASTALVQSVVDLGLSLSYM